jgi:hypothetical protein
MYEDKKICVLVNRSQDMYLMPLNLPRAMFQGSVMDGELVQTETGWTYIVYDCLMVSNVHVSHLSLTQRMEKASEAVSGIMKLAKDPIKVKTKTFWPLSQFGEFTKTPFPYRTDGIVLTPVNEPVRIGTHETLFKWKPRDENTIEFQVKWLGNKWGMDVQEKGNLVFESELKPDRHPGIDLQEDAIVECQYVHWEHPRWWRPVNIRTDKVHPNNRRTFYKTLTNISEDIQLQEFASF